MWFRVKAMGLILSSEKMGVGVGRERQRKEKKKKKKKPTINGGTCLKSQLLGRIRQEDHEFQCAGNLVRPYFWIHPSILQKRSRHKKHVHPN